MEVYFAVGTSLGQFINRDLFQKGFYAVSVRLELGSARVHRFDVLQV
jgi:hypothetical protein